MARRRTSPPRPRGRLAPPGVDLAEIPEAPWAEVMRALKHEWEQGQHVTLLGKNGSGKTTLAFQLLDIRKYVVILLTKHRDDLFPLAKKRGYKMLEAGDEQPSAQSAPKVAIHIPPEGLTREAGQKQAAEIRELLYRLWKAGGWTIYLDEIATLADQLGLAPDMRQLWKEARSSRITIVAGTQRPARIPIEAYDQPRFLFFWRNNSREALKRLADMHGPDPEIVRGVVVQLERFEVLIVDTVTDELVRTMPPKLR